MQNEYLNLPEEVAGTGAKVIKKPLFKNKGFFVGGADGNPLQNYLKATHFNYIKNYLQTKLIRLTVQPWPYTH
jgi:hypothetical protein